MHDAAISHHITTGKQSSSSPTDRRWSERRRKKNSVLGDLRIEATPTAEEQTMETIDRTTAGVDPSTPLPVGTRPIRNTRLRVAKVLKRLRKRAPTNAAGKLPSLDRLNEEHLESRSEVSGITDVGDDLSCYAGENTSNRRQSQRIPPSVTPAFPGKTSNSTDPSLSESLETWCE